MNLIQNPKHSEEQELLKSQHIAQFYDYSGHMGCVNPRLLRDYNASIKMATHQREGGHKCSLDVVPDKIMIVIIQEAAITRPEPFPSPRRLLLYTLVTHRWANLILTTPYMWTDIDLRSDFGDLEATTALQLELSMNCPLELIYYRGSDPIRRVADLLQPHLHRFASFSIAQSRHNTGSDPFFPQAVFPSLQRFEAWKMPSHDIFDFLSRQELFAPYTHLAVDNVTIYCMTLRGNCPVSISLPASSALAIRYVEDIKTLKKVKIFGADSPSEDWSAVANATHTQLSWEVLKLDNLPWPVMHGLLSRCASLVSLRLKVKQNQAPILLDLIASLVFLDKLVIRLLPDPHEEAVAAISSDHRKETKLRRMEIKVDQCTMEGGTRADIVHSLLWMSPRLEYFTLSGYRGTKFHLILLEKIKQLRKLTLKGCELTSKPGDARHILASPHLEVVESEGTTNVISSLGSQTANRLIYTSPPGTTKLKSETIQVRGEDWPALRALSLELGEIRRVKLVVSAMTLRRLNLSGRPIITKMVHHLARYPSELPLLDTLELKSCPEWDILFIMLEKRLLLRTSRVNPIEKIIFSRVIPTKLKRALSLLTAGYIVSRMSNYELSMQGNKEIFSDIDIPGCVECHLYLHPCDLPVNNASLAQPKLQMKYPNTVDKILETQSLRYDEMDGIYCPLISTREWRRKPKCGRLRGMVEISCYSIDSWDCMDDVVLQ